MAAALTSVTHHDLAARNNDNDNGNDDGDQCIHPLLLRVAALNVWWLSEDVHKYFDKG